MANMNTSHRYIYDAAPATLFRARTAAAITATGNSDEVDLDALDGYWNTDGELADETLAVVINVTDLDNADGDETYAFALVATDGAGTEQTAIDLGGFTVNAVGQYVLLVDVPSAKLADADFAGLQIAATIGGSTGQSLTYHAWMSQIKKA